MSWRGSPARRSGLTAVWSLSSQGFNVLHSESTRGCLQESWKEAENRSTSAGIGLRIGWGSAADGLGELLILIRKLRCGG